MSRFKLLLGYSTGLAVMAAAYPAFAQVLEAPPPTQYSLDARGVDVVRGSFNFSTTEVAIGPPGAGGLTYERTFMAGGWRDNLTGTIEELPGYRYAVSIGAMTEVFQREVSGAYTPERNTGSTLVAGFTYTTSDGTTALFSPPMSTNPTNPAGLHAGRILNMIRPNGERMDFHYKDFRIGPVWDPDAPYVTRLQGVENNLGYVIKLRYALDNPTAPIDQGPFFQLVEVMGVNRAVDTCAPEGDSCPGLTRNWPKATYGPPAAWETVTDGVGLTTSYQANANGILGIRYPGSAVNDVTVAYGGGGRVSSVAAAGATWTYGYSDVGPVRTTTITDPLSNASVATSSLVTGLMTLWRDAAFQTTGYVYDVEGRLINTTLPEGNQVLLTLDARGNVTQTTVVPKSGSGLANIVTSAVYPASCASPVTCNLPTSTTDARGFRTDYAWNATHGGLESATQPAPSGAAPIGSGTRPEARIAYATQTAWYKNNLGVVVAAPWSVTLPVSTSTCAVGSAPTCVGTADEIKTTVVYGASGVANNLLPTSTTSGDGAGALAATTATTWTPDGDIETVDGPLSGSGDLTRYRYDAARRPVGAVGPDPDGAGALRNRAVRIGYDVRGLVTLTEQGATSGYTDPDWAAFSTLQRTAATYDAYRRPVTQAAQDAAGAPHQLIQVSYDGASRAECTALRMNPGAFGTLPGSACTLGAAGAFGPDRITHQAYDAVGRPSVTTSGWGTTSALAEAVTYTANGRPQDLTDGRGNASVVVYDGFDRPDRMRYPNATGGGTSTTDYEQYGYDAGSNPTSYRTRANQTFATAYDNLSRPVATTAPAGTPDVTRAYDNLGRLTSASVTGGVSTAMTWDALGRQLTETGPTGTMTYGYDLAGRRTSQTWPDSFAITYDWNVLGEMTFINRPGGAIVAYAYDDLGRRSAMGRSNGLSTTYAYDGVSRLTGLTHHGSPNVSLTYAHNPAGQIVSRTMSNPAYAYAGPSASTGYALDGLNRIVGFGYDDNGNLTNDGARTYAYDAASRLIGGGSPAGALSYDAFGRLDTLTGAYGGRFVYDGVEAVASTTPSTNVIDNHFVRGPGVDEIVANYPSAALSNPLFWLLDERNSLMALTDIAGATPYTNGYDEYGQPRPGNLGRFQYTGQLLMPDFGAYHYKARAYSPGLGRLLQTDPIGYAAGANLYAYVGNDPVNFVDPMGLIEVISTCLTRVWSVDPGYWNSEVSHTSCTYRWFGDASGVFDGGLIVSHGSWRRGVGDWASAIVNPRDFCQSAPSLSADTTAFLGQIFDSIGVAGIGIDAQRAAGAVQADRRFRSLFSASAGAAAGSVVVGEALQFGADLNAGSGVVPALAGVGGRLAATGAYAAVGGAAGFAAGGAAFGPEAAPAGGRLGAALGAFGASLGPARAWGDVARTVAAGGAC